ncbi:HAD family hydrolase [Kribbella capetownensis]|uniref:HAD family hydrolase n=1 Tax=Kribbella capetownensis TaxID=1572659 RepID=UPI00192D71BF|nr:HAD family hydrolase [Kribbella capetownensis]
MTLKGVLFDLDGTLVEQESAAAAAVVDWAAEHGITDPDVSARWAAVSDRHYMRYQRRELTFAEQRRNRVREFLGVDVSDEHADELFQGYLQRYEAGWTLFDDAVPALRRVRAAGLATVVFTNGNTDHQRFKLGRFGLSDEIDVLISSEMLPAGKPDPRAFLHALDLLQLTPSEALMVGDSLEKDVRGALAVGIDAVLVDRYDEHADVEVRRIRSLHELSGVS